MIKTCIHTILRGYQIYDAKILNQEPIFASGAHPNFPERKLFPDKAKNKYIEKHAQVL